MTDKASTEHGWTRTAPADGTLCVVWTGSVFYTGYIQTWMNEGVRVVDLACERGLSFATLQSDEKFRYLPISTPGAEPRSLMCGDDPLGRCKEKPRKSRAAKTGKRKPASGAGRCADFDPRVTGSDGRPPCCVGCADYYSTATCFGCSRMSGKIADDDCYRVTGSETVIDQTDHRLVPEPCPACTPSAESEEPVCGEACQGWSDKRKECILKACVIKGDRICDDFNPYPPQEPSESDLTDDPLGRCEEKPRRARAAKTKKREPASGAEGRACAVCGRSLGSKPYETCPNCGLCNGPPRQPSGERCGTCAEWDEQARTQMAANIIAVGLRCRNIIGPVRQSNPACEHYRPAPTPESAHGALRERLEEYEAEIKETSEQIHALLPRYEPCERLETFAYQARLMAKELAEMEAESAPDLLSQVCDGIRDRAEARAAADADGGEATCGECASLFEADKIHKATNLKLNKSTYCANQNVTGDIRLACIRNRHGDACEHFVEPRPAPPCQPSDSAGKADREGATCGECSTWPVGWLSWNCPHRSTLKLQESHHGACNLFSSRHSPTPKEPCGRRAGHAEQTQPSEGESSDLGKRLDAIEKAWPWPAMLDGSVAERHTKRLDALREELAAAREHWETDVGQLRGTLEGQWPPDALCKRLKRLEAARLSDQCYVMAGDYRHALERIAALERAQEREAGKVRELARDVADIGQTIMNASGTACIPDRLAIATSDARALAEESDPK